MQISDLLLFNHSRLDISVYSGNLVPLSSGFNGRVVCLQESENNADQMLEMRFFIAKTRYFIFRDNKHFGESCTIL